MKFVMETKKSFALRSIFASAIFSCLFFAAATQLANGQTETFAQFSQSSPGQIFVFTNNTPTDATFATTSGSIPIDFEYLAVNGTLSPALTGDQAATLTITTTTTTATVSNAAGFLFQPLNGTITITITRNTAAPVGTGTGSRTNLLTAVISPGNSNPVIFGQNNGTSGNFSASSGSSNQNVTFTSDFLTFNNTTERDLALAFSSIQPALAINGNFLRSFTAAGTGTFASNPRPFVSNPTAATVTVSGRVLTSSGRGLRNALVTVTQADGSSRTVLTNATGRYSFADLVIPQTIVISVASKRYNFNSRIVSLDNDFSELNFVADDGKYQ